MIGKEALGRVENIIRSQFDVEIQAKKQEARLIEHRLNQARGLLNEMEGFWDDLTEYEREHLASSLIPPEPSRDPAPEIPTPPPAEAPTTAQPPTQAPAPAPTASPTNEKAPKSEVNLNIEKTTEPAQPATAVAPAVDPPPPQPPPAPSIPTDITQVDLSTITDPRIRLKLSREIAKLKRQKQQQAGANGVEKSKSEAGERQDSAMTPSPEPSADLMSPQEVPSVTITTQPPAPATAIAQKAEGPDEDEMVVMEESHSAAHHELETSKTTQLSPSLGPASHTIPLSPHGHAEDTHSPVMLSSLHPKLRNKKKWDSFHPSPSMQPISLPSPTLGAIPHEKLPTPAQTPELQPHPPPLPLHESMSPPPPIQPSPARMIDHQTHAASPPILPSADMGGSTMKEPAAMPPPPPAVSVKPTESEEDQAHYGHKSPVIMAVQPPQQQLATFAKRRIVIGNVSRFIPPEHRPPGDPSTHKWMVYVRGFGEHHDISSFVSRIVFVLHPSFRPNDHIEAPRPPYCIIRRGWGEFPIRVQVSFYDEEANKPITVSHQLYLDRSMSGELCFANETHIELELQTFDGEPISPNTPLVTDAPRTATRFEYVSRGQPIKNTQLFITKWHMWGDYHFFDDDGTDQDADVGVNIPLPNLDATPVSTHPHHLRAAAHGAAVTGGAEDEEMLVVEEDESPSATPFAAAPEHVPPVDPGSFLREPAGSHLLYADGHSSADPWLKPEVGQERAEEDVYAQYAAPYAPMPLSGWHTPPPVSDSSDSGDDSEKDADYRASSRSRSKKGGKSSRSSSGGTLAATKGLRPQATKQLASPPLSAPRRSSSGGGGGSTTKDKKKKQKQRSGDASERVRAESSSSAESLEETSTSKHSAQRPKDSRPKARGYSGVGLLDSESSVSGNESEMGKKSPDQKVKQKDDRGYASPPIAQQKPPQIKQEDEHVELTLSPPTGGISIKVETASPLCLTPNVSPGLIPKVAGRSDGANRGSTVRKTGRSLFSELGEEKRQQPAPAATVVKKSKRTISSSESSDSSSASTSSGDDRPVKAAGKGLKGSQNQHQHQQQQQQRPKQKTHSTPLLTESAAIRESYRGHDRDFDPSLFAAASSGEEKSRAKQHSSKGQHAHATAKKGAKGLARPAAKKGCKKEHQPQHHQPVNDNSSDSYVPSPPRSKRRSESTEVAPTSTPSRPRRKSAIYSAEKEQQQQQLLVPKQEEQSTIGTVAMVLHEGETAQHDHIPQDSHAPPADEIYHAEGQDHLPPTPEEPTTESSPKMSASSPQQKDASSPPPATAPPRPAQPQSQKDKTAEGTFSFARITGDLLSFRPSPTTTQPPTTAGDSSKHEDDEPATTTAPAPKRARPSITLKITTTKLQESGGQEEPAAAAPPRTPGGSLLLDAPQPTVLYSSSPIDQRSLLPPVIPTSVSTAEQEQLPPQDHGSPHMGAKKANVRRSSSIGSEPSFKRKKRATVLLTDDSSSPQTRPSAQPAHHAQQQQQQAPMEGIYDGVGQVTEASPFAPMMDQQQGGSSGGDAMSPSLDSVQQQYHYQQQQQQQQQQQLAQQQAAMQAHGTVQITAKGTSYMYKVMNRDLTRLEQMVVDAAAMHPLIAQDPTYVNAEERWFLAGYRLARNIEEWCEFSVGNRKSIEYRRAKQIQRHFARLPTGPLPWSLKQLCAFLRDSGCTPVVLGDISVLDEIALSEGISAPKPYSKKKDLWEPTQHCKYCGSPHYPMHDFEHLEEACGRKHGLSELCSRGRPCLTFVTGHRFEMVLRERAQRSKTFMMALDAFPFTAPAPQLPPPSTLFNRSNPDLPPHYYRSFIPPSFSEEHDYPMLSPEHGHTVYHSSSTALAELHAALHEEASSFRKLTAAMGIKTVAERAGRSQMRTELAALMAVKVFANKLVREMTQVFREQHAEGLAAFHAQVAEHSQRGSSGSRVVGSILPGGRPYQFATASASSKQYGEKYDKAQIAPLHLVEAIQRHPEWDFLFEAKLVRRHLSPSTDRPPQAMFSTPSPMESSSMGSGRIVVGSGPSNIPSIPTAQTAQTQQAALMLSSLLGGFGGGSGGYKPAPTTTTPTAYQALAKNMAVTAAAMQQKAVQQMMMMSGMQGLNSITSAMLGGVGAMSAMGGLGGMSGMGGMGNMANMMNSFMKQAYSPAAATAPTSSPAPAPSLAQRPTPPMAAGRGRGQSFGASHIPSGVAARTRNGRGRAMTQPPGGQTPQTRVSVGSHIQIGRSGRPRPPPASHAQPQQQPPPSQ